jgi:hypothetical protein
MKNIKRFENFDEEVSSNFFDFNRTLPVVSKSHLTNKCSCQNCHNNWSVFNKRDPQNCPKCGSEDISIKNSSGDTNDLEYLGTLGKKYEKLDQSSYPDVVEEVKRMIESTIERSGGEIDTFVDTFIKDSSTIKIEGLINDSDIYDFYLKYRNSVDEVLNEIKFYDEVPSKLNSFGLYDYLIVGTNRAILEFVKMINPV